LLNVRAEGMSAWAGEPDHFAKRLASEGGHPRQFAERRLFGCYLGEILGDAVASGKVSVIEHNAVSAERVNQGWVIDFEDGTRIEARTLALATGNQEPERIGAFAAIARRFIANPWGGDARAAVSELGKTGGAALIIGTGLTMVDLVLSLDASGFSGDIVAISRRGLIPRSHSDFQPAPIDDRDLPRGRLSCVTRWLRQRARDVGWRAAVDSLRPFSHAMWQRLEAGEQRRFLRHARPWWDVHRHRIAPEVATVLERLRSEGRLEIIAGRITGARETAKAIDVEFRRRGAEAEDHRSFAFAFNCTGPLHKIQRTPDPLLRSLFDSHSVRPDHLGIGLDVDQWSRAGERIWALGPLTKGRYWEIIAVPDIREQAALVADDIERELSQ
jgi:uncharacterized NAD(P)/FAD-binding protein YdhS